MTKVKGSTQFHMKVVPHRPFRTLLMVLMGGVAMLVAVVITWLYVEYRSISPAEANAMREEQSYLKQEVDDLRQQLTQAQMNSEVDRKSSEELRQQLLVRREQIAQLEREVAVYKMMSSRVSRNPLGIGFGRFSVRQISDDSYHIKLVVQKLAENDTEFVGHLESTLVGNQAGAERRIPLAQVSVAVEGAQPVQEKMPVQFKYFQNIETDLRLPEGFEPVRMEVRLVSSAQANPLVVEHQLDWQTN